MAMKTIASIRFAKNTYGVETQIRIVDTTTDESIMIGYLNGKDYVGNLPIDNNLPLSIKLELIKTAMINGTKKPS
jgi:hypothetical protein